MERGRALGRRLTELVLNGGHDVVRAAQPAGRGAAQLHVILAHRVPTDGHSAVRQVTEVTEVKDTEVSARLCRECRCTGPGRSTLASVLRANHFQRLPFQRLYS